jgi:hypothetical protein
VLGIAPQRGDVLALLGVVEIGEAREPGWVPRRPGLVVPSFH